MTEFAKAWFSEVGVPSVICDIILLHNPDGLP